jgi:hypothetical protein
MFGEGCGLWNSSLCNFLHDPSSSLLDNSFKSHNRLYYRKHNGIAHFYYEYVSQPYAKAKSVWIWKSTPTPWTDASISFVSTVKYIISFEDSEGSMLVSSHASTVYAPWRIKSKKKGILPTVFPTYPTLT